MLGSNNAAAAREALAAYPDGLHVGGGITLANAREWVEEHKAEKVIVTSALFVDGVFSHEIAGQVCACVCVCVCVCVCE